MNKSSLFLRAALVAAVTGCGASTNSGAKGTEPTDKEPVVSAQASVTSGVAPLEVAFTGQAAGGDGELTYEWEFGDGDASDELSPTHTYIANGTFNAKLTATDEDGDFATANVTIVVGTPSTPAVTAAADVTQGLAPLTVNFTATVVGGDAPVNVAWNFGDGETSGEMAPQHVYTAAGQYGAVVTATDASGDTASATVLINVGSDKLPAVAISANPTSGPAPLPVTFAANVTGGDLPYTFAWDFGDGTTSTTQNPSKTYNADGTYQAKIKVTDADGDVAEVSTTIVVNSGDTSGTMPDLQIGSLDAYSTGLTDAHEPNDATSVYLGGWQDSPYTITDGYIDEIDVTWVADVVNFGGALSTTFDVDFYQHVPGGPSASALGDDYRQLTNLEANGTKQVLFTRFDIEPLVTQESWIRLDTFDTVEESVETNNQDTLSVLAYPDVDWFAVTQDLAGLDIEVTLSNLPADYDVELYDEDGYVVAWSENAGTTSESIVYTPSASGLYFIRVYGYDNARNSSQPYHLNIVVN